MLFEEACDICCAVARATPQHRHEVVTHGSLSATCRGVSDHLGVGLEQPLVGTALSKDEVDREPAETTRVLPRRRSVRGLRWSMSGSLWRSHVTYGARTARNSAPSGSWSSEGRTLEEICERGAKRLRASQFRVNEDQRCLERNVGACSVHGAVYGTTGGIVLTRRPGRLGAVHRIPTQRRGPTPRRTGPRSRHRLSPTRGSSPPQSGAPRASPDRGESRYCRVLQLATARLAPIGSHRAVPHARRAPSAGHCAAALKKWLMYMG